MAGLKVGCNASLRAGMQVAGVGPDFMKFVYVFTPVSFFLLLLFNHVYIKAFSRAKACSIAGLPEQIQTRRE